MNCINLESPGKVFPGAVPSDRPDRSLAAFMAPCGNSPWRIVRGRSARVGFASKAFRDRQPKPERRPAPGPRDFALDPVAVARA